MGTATLERLAQEELRRRRELADVGLRGAAKALRVSLASLQRYEVLEREAPPELLDRAARLYARRPPEERARRAVGHRGGKTRPELEEQLRSDPAARRALEALIVSGQVREDLVVRTDASGRRRVRGGLYRTSSASGLDRTTPKLDGAALRAALRVAGISTKQLARIMDVDASRIRDWTRTAPPRGRLDELADLLAAWCPDGQTLRRLRLAAGWPLERVAEECGVHKARASRVSAWESGARKIPAGRRLQVLAACDLMASEAGEPLRIRKERILALVGNNGGRAPLKEVHHQFRRIVNRRYLDDPLTNEAIATLLHEKALHLVETADPDGAPTARSKPWLYVLDPKSPRLTGVQAGNRRDAAGVTLRAFARTVGCTEPTLRRLERSESRLPLHRAVVFEAVLRDFERRGTVAERVARDVLAVVAARPGIPRYAVSYAVRDQIGNVRGVQGTFGYSGHLLPTVDAMVHDGRLVYGNAWDLRGCLYQGLYLPAEVHRAPRDTAVFAGRLRELRRAAELTCAELAAMVDVSPNAVSRWETGVRSLSPARMVQLQAALGARRTRA